MQLRLVLLTSLALVLCPLASTATSPKEDHSETFRLKNGRFWMGLSDVARPYFLMGLADGWTLRGHTEETVKGSVILALSSCSDTSYGELAEMVTAAYEQPENRVLPIGWVMMADLAIGCGKTTPEKVFPALLKHLTAVNDAVSKSRITREEGVYVSRISPIDVIAAASEK